MSASMPSALSALTAELPPNGTASQLSSRSSPATSICSASLSCPRKCRPESESPDQPKRTPSIWLCRPRRASTMLATRFRTSVGRSKSGDAAKPTATAAAIHRCRRLGCQVLNERKRAQAGVGHSFEPPSMASSEPEEKPALPDRLPRAPCLAKYADKTAHPTCALFGGERLRLTYLAAAEPPRRFTRPSHAVPYGCLVSEITHG